MTEAELEERVAEPICFLIDCECCEDTPYCQLIARAVIRAMRDANQIPAPKVE